MTSDCGHYPPPPRPTTPRLPCPPEGHTKLPAAVEGSQQRVLTTLTGMATPPLLHGRANQETMQRGRAEKVPRLTFSPFAARPLTPVLSPRPDSRGQPEVRLRETCCRPFCVGARASNRKWMWRCKAAKHDDVILRKNRIQVYTNDYGMDGLSHD